MAGEGQEPVIGVSWKEYVDTIFHEHQKALEVQEGVRERAAQVLRAEHNRASDQAEREREKAALVLVDGMHHAMAEGVERLREHVMAQIESIHSALESASLLEVSRFDQTRADVASLRRETKLVYEAQKDAVQKAEEAQKDVNHRNNEYRAQLKDQNDAQMPRLEAEARLNQMAEQIAAINEKLGKLT